MRLTLLSLYLCVSSVLGQKVVSLTAIGAPYPVTDPDGNARGFDPQKAVLWDSKKPGVRPSAIILEKTSSTSLFTIQLSGAKAGTLTGTIDGKPLIVPVKQKGGNIRMSARLDKSRVSTGAPWAIMGTILFAIDGKEFEQIPVEIYAVSQTIPTYFQKYGIYRELLQFILPANDGFNTLPRDVAGYNAHVDRKLHFESKFKYETYHGASRYVKYPNLGNANKPLTGTLNLKGWLKDRKNVATLATAPTVNCYDQASLTQVCLSLGATPMNLLNVAYLKPYGYIKPTSLIGYPNIKCNSPIFRGNTALASMPAMSANRTYFKNHMITIQGKTTDKASLLVHDSCSGPFTGNVALPKYMTSAIDTQNSRGFKVPALSTVRIGSGIYDTNTFSITGATPATTTKRDDDDSEEALKKRLNSMKAKNDNSKTATTVYRPDFSKLGDALKHKVIQSSTQVGDDATVFDYTCRLRNDVNKDVNIRVTVTNDNKAAFTDFVTEIGQMSTELEDSFQGPSDKQRFGDWTIVSKESTGQGTLMFVAGNILVDISGLKVSQDLQEFADAVYKFITEPKVQALSTSGSLSFGAMSGNVEVKVGQTHNMAISVSNVLKSSWSLKSGNAIVTYMKHSNGKLELDIVGVKAGEDVITLTIADAGGKVVKSRPLMVKVTA